MIPTIVIKLPLGHQILLLANYSKELNIAHKTSLVGVIKVCSRGGATYIVCQIIAKTRLNIANLICSNFILLRNTLTEQLVVEHKCPCVDAVKYCINKFP